VYVWPWVSDPDYDPLTLTVATPPAHGSVQMSGNQFVYTPTDPRFVGTDTFTYTADDGLGGTATGTITVALLTRR
jgi:hypothetical protein